MSWTAIWDRTGAHHAPPSPPPARGQSTFVLEGRLAFTGGSRNLWRGGQTANQDFSIDQDRRGRLVIRRADQSQTIDETAIAPGDPFRVCMRTDPNRPFAILDLNNLSSGQTFSLSLNNVATLGLSDVLPNDPHLNERTEFAAFANQDAPIREAAGFEMGTQIQTPSGPRPIESLRAGDIVITGQGAPARLLETERREALTLGAMAAIRFRAPYFGLAKDVVLSPHHQVALSGPEVDYMFGCPTVHARACDLIDHVSVQQDFSQPTRVFYRARLDRSGSIGLGRAQVETGASDLGDGPRIDRVSAHALRAMQRDSRGLLG